MCHRSGTKICHPTETRYIFVQILIFPTLKCEQPCRCKHVCVTCLFLLWFPSLSVCLRCATSYETVADVDKQRGYETFIVPALINENMFVLTLLYVIFTCTDARTIAKATVQYIAKTWLQKKEMIFAVIFMYDINVHESFDEANEEDDGWKTGPRFLKKK